MGSEWKENRLDTITELIVDCPHSTPKWTESGVIVLRNQYIRNGRIDLSAPSFTNEEHYKKRVKRAVPQSGDLVLTREAPMGEVGQIPEGVKCCLGQRMVLVRADQSKVLPKYLLFSFQSRHVQYQIGWSKGTGTTVSNLRIPYIKALKIPLPPLSEQRRIAHILSTLDDKIALNRQQNATLEAMAQALFRSWFVDFDPVLDKALAAGHPIPPPLQAKAQRRLELGDRRKPLPAKVAALFPDRFVYHEEVGWVPEGWAVKPLDEIANFLNGLALQKYPVIEGRSTLPRIKIREMRQGISDSTDWSNADVPEKYIINNGDVLFSWSGSLIVDIWTEGKGALNQHLFKVSSDKYPKWFYLYWTKHHLKEFIRIAETKATTMGHINRSHLKSSYGFIPCNGLLDWMEKTISPILSRIIENRLNVKRLANLRDTLLPKLISGELRVPEAETLIP